MSAGLVVLHPQGLVVLADGRKTRGREVVTDRSRKVWVIGRVVVLHLGYAGRDEELETFMFERQGEKKDWEAEGLAWGLAEAAERRWKEILPGKQPVLFFACDVVEGLKRCFRVEVRREGSVIEGMTMRGERLIRTIAAGDETFQVMVTQGRLAEGAKDLHEVVKRGRFALETLQRWVEMRDGWSSFGGEVQGAVILNTGSVIYPV